MSERLSFHHIGVVCTDLDKEFANFSVMGYACEGGDFEDPIQGVKGRFLVAPSQPRLELLVNAGEQGVLDPWLKKGIKFYHFAYEVCELEEAIAALVGKRGKVLVEPVAAKAFEDRRVAFVMMPGRLLIELIEL
jgi:methylmalonyl-CoA/ethylmalonyl-CoA epimerase